MITLRRYATSTHWHRWRRTEIVTVMSIPLQLIGIDGDAPQYSLEAICRSSALESTADFSELSA